MREIEAEFLEQYKRTDNICRDMFSAETGITEYISRLEKSQRAGMSRIPGWNSWLYDLKHLRYVRNQITHSTGSSDCNEEDLATLDDFRERLLNYSDPLSLLHQMENGSADKKEPDRREEKPGPEKREEKTEPAFSRKTMEKEPEEEPIKKAEIKQPEQVKKGSGFDFLAFLTILLAFAVLAGVVYIIIFVIPNASDLGG